MTRFQWRPGDIGPARFGLTDEQWRRLVLLYQDVQSGKRTEWPECYRTPRERFYKYLVADGRINEGLNR